MTDNSILQRRWTKAGGLSWLSHLSAVVARLTTGGLLALAAFTVASTVYYVIRTHTNLPEADEWYSLDLYERIIENGNAVKLLFEPHNEHRLFFPRLIFFSDYLFFVGSGRFDKVVIFITQSLEAGLFVWLANRSGAGIAARAALSAIAVILLFSLCQNENFVWGFQVQFVGVFACASLCCTMFAFGLAAGPETRRGGAMTVGAFVLVLLATFTMANGLLTGPVLVVLAIVSKARRVVVFLCAVVAITAIVAFSTGYHLDPDPNRESATELLTHLPRVLAFAAGYLGNLVQFGQTSQITLGVCGLVALAAMAGVMMLRSDRDAGCLSLLGISLFAAASALVTAVGRSGAGLQYIEASRYSTGAAVFWAATLLNAWSLSRGRSRGVVARAAVCLVMALLLKSSWMVQLTSGLDMERRAIQYDAMEDAMLLGLYDIPALAAFEEPVGKAREMEPVLRRLHISIFGSRDAHLVGRPLAEAEAPGAQPLACVGGFTAAVMEPALGAGGVAVSGAARLHSRLGRPSRIYIVDDERRIVGFAHTGFGDGLWTGYARSRPGTELSAWAMSDARRLCRLGSAVVSLRMADG